MGSVLAETYEMGLKKFPWHKYLGQRNWKPNQTSTQISSNRNIQMKNKTQNLRLYINNQNKSERSPRTWFPSEILNNNNIHIDIRQWIESEKMMGRAERTKYTSNLGHNQIYTKWEFIKIVSYYFSKNKNCAVLLLLLLFFFYEYFVLLLSMW